MPARYQLEQLEHAEEARIRRALLHMLEDLRRERAVLRHARREWLLTVDALAEPIVVHDGEFRIVRCNSAYTLRAGMPFQDLLGRPYWECFPKRSGPLPGVQVTVPGDSAADYEFAAHTGEIYLLRAYAIRDSEAGADTVLNVFIDISQRRHAEEALRQQLDELRRWHACTTGREERIIALKREVNELLSRAHEPPRYASANFDTPTVENTA